MRRYICLYLPNLAIERTIEACKCNPNIPIALIKTVSNQSQIVLCSSPAKKSGLKPGMTTTLAKALAPSLQTFPYEPLQDFKLLYKLAVKLISLTPLVALNNDLVKAYKTNTLALLKPEHTGIILDITGTERLYKTEQNLATKIFRLFEESRFTVLIGISSTVGSAWALSRYGFLHPNSTKSILFKDKYTCIAAPTRPALINSLELLPLSALRILKNTKQQLNELGLYYIKDLSRFTYRQLALRFGTQLTTRLDQAFGNIVETLYFLHPHKHIRIDREFFPPLHSHTNILSALFQNLNDLIKKLSEKNRKASKFVLVIQGNDPTKEVSKAHFCIRKNFYLHSETKSFNHISSIVSPFFENITIPEGVSRITLSAEILRPALPSQTESLASGKTIASDEEKNELLNLLTAQLGYNNLKTISVFESHIPENMYRFLPLEQQTSLPKNCLSNFNYPTTILKVPEKIVALSLLPDAPPTKITWKNKQLNIIKGFGPEKISYEWWQTTVRSRPDYREYFRVQDENGYWLWLFRTQSNMHWFIHGFWI